MQSQKMEAERGPRLSPLFSTQRVNAKPPYFPYGQILFSWHLQSHAK